MMRSCALNVTAVLLGACCLPGCGSGAGVPGPPATPRMPVTDAYHGVEVVDDYRWLEDWNEPDVKRWSEAQNAYARSVLDGLDSRGAIEKRVTELRSAQADSYSSLAWRNGQLFALKRQPPKQQPFLIVLTSPGDLGSARTLVDPNTIDASGSTAIDFFEPSWNGKLVAVSLSKGGSESGDVHVFDATGTEVFETVPRVQGGTAGGDVAWTVDDTGFFYTRYPHEGEVAAADLSFFQQVYFHRLGTPPAGDAYEFGKGLPRVAEIRLDAHPTKRYVAASVQHGDGGGIEQYLRTPDGQWRRLAEIPDRVAKMQFGPNDDLLAVTTKGAPRGRIVRMPLADARLDRARPVVGESAGVILTDFWEADPNPVVTATRIFVPYQMGGPTDLKAFDLQGRPQKNPDVLPVSSVSALTSMRDDLLFLNVSYLVPPAWYHFSAATAVTHKTALARKAPFSFDDAEVVQESATSKDGTRVPYLVIRPKGASGPLPFIVTGYGGYGVSSSPGFDPINRMILDQGIGVAEAIIRGGGEFGDEWHEQGKLTHKQNVFDDFAAVLMQMVERRETTSDRLAIIGGSNGGLLMGATFTQHPSLAHAVVSFVGIYDMLRVERSPNGAFNVPEFGTVTDRAQFEALYAYSPYHHVRDGTQYPAILFLTGANDPRVDPMQSRKMTARLQASGTKQPVLLRTSGNTGHGIGTPLGEAIQQNVDVYSFLFHELGVMFNPGRG